MELRPAGPETITRPDQVSSRRCLTRWIRALAATSRVTPGLVGSAVTRRLEAAGFTNILTATRQQLDLRDQAEVSHWFKANRPEYVYLVAGTVGGIMANSTRPAEFIYDNMMIHGTVVRGRQAVRRDEAAVPRLVVHLPPPGHAADHGGASCSPDRSSRPTSGTRSPRSPASSCARPTARQYGCDFISAMPTNLYGPGDNFDLTSSHVLPALIRKFHDAARWTDPRSRSGAPAHRCASSSTSTTSPTPACS